MLTFKTYSFTFLQKKIQISYILHTPYRHRLRLLSYVIWTSLFTSHFALRWNLGNLFLVGWRIFFTKCANSSQKKTRMWITSIRLRLCQNCLHKLGIEYRRTQHFMGLWPEEIRCKKVMRVRTFLLKKILHKICFLPKFFSKLTLVWVFFVQWAESLQISRGGLWGRKMSVEWYGCLTTRIEMIKS